MPDARDVVIVGGGHNGLVAAFYLARAGLKPVVLERRPVVGGAAITGEIHPGFQAPLLAHAGGPMLARIVRDMRLDGRGVDVLRPDPRLLALSPDGAPLALYDDPARSAAAIARRSPRDAERFVPFHESLDRIGGLIASLVTVTPPSMDDPSAGDLWSLLGAAGRFRRLGRTDGYRLLRWMPMAVADLVAEWFETDLLRAALAGRGILGAFLGPWSAGSGAAFLIQAGHDSHSAGPAWFVQGGMGALTRGLAAAAEEAGATIRTDAGVERIQIRDGRVTGVVLDGGEEIDARLVVSNADPRRTFLGLADPIHFDPDFLTKVRGYRTPGVTAKVNLALSRLPRFAGVQAGGTDGQSLLSGRIHVGPGIDYLERAFDAAKYGAYSPEPYLDIVIPTMLDPGLAPAGAHVMSIVMQFAPRTLRDGEWAAHRDALGDTVVRAIGQYASDLRETIVARQVVTPAELEEEYGLSGGHIHHGEMSLDQLFTMRPILGWARYRTPVAGLYLCGAGTHPGGGVTGAPGLNAAREIVKDFRSRT